MLKYVFFVFVITISSIAHSTPIKVNIVGIDIKSEVWSGRAMINLVDTLSEARLGTEIRSFFIPSPNIASPSDMNKFIENNPDYIIFMDDFHYHFFASSVAKKTNAKIGFASLYAQAIKFNKVEEGRQFGVIQAPSPRNFELIRKYSDTTKFLMVGGPLAKNMGLRIRELTENAGFEKSDIVITDKWDEFREAIASTDRETLTLILAPFQVYNEGHLVSSLEFADAINTCPSPSVTIKDIKHADPLFTLTGSPEKLGVDLGKSLINFIKTGNSPGVIDSYSSGLTISRGLAKKYIREFNTPEVVGFFRHGGLLD